MSGDSDILGSFPTSGGEDALRDWLGGVLGTGPGSGGDGTTGPVQRTFQPTLPGGMDMLGSQLQAGYGSGGGDMDAFLANLYQPMDIKQIMGIPGSTPDTPPPAATPPPADRVADSGIRNSLRDLLQGRI
jgi:hypothetical protein